MAFKISRVQRLSAVICISFAFFAAEIAVGFYTHSLVLIADAFHYLSDLVGFVVALVAAIISENPNPPKSLTYGWQRAQLLGAFFNGVLLLGLGISVFLQSVERFISLERIEQPKLVFIMGAIGLFLNIISILFLHEHHHHGHAHGHSHSHSHDHHDIEHKHGSEGASKEIHDEKHVHHKHSVNATKEESHGHKHDLAMMGVFIHLLGDAGNNLGVMAAALVIWFAHYDGRYYADPAASMGISLMILASCFPLIKQAGLILLQSAPEDVDHDDVRHDLETTPGVLAVHELHIWRLNQTKSLASAHITLSNDSISNFTKMARTISECFHAYGIHSVTLQPEVVGPEQEVSGETTALVQSEPDRQSTEKLPKNDCQIVCGELCQDFACCH